MNCIQISFWQLRTAHNVRVTDETSSTLNYNHRALPHRLHFLNCKPPAVKMLSMGEIHFWYSAVMRKIRNNWNLWHHKRNLRFANFGRWVCSQWNHMNLTVENHHNFWIANLILTLETAFILRKGNDMITGGRFTVRDMNWRQLVCINQFWFVFRLQYFDKCARCCFKTKTS